MVTVLAVSVVSLRRSKSHSGEGGIQGHGKGEETRGLEVGGTSVSTCRDRGTFDFKVDTQCNGLGEDVADPRFCYGFECIQHRHFEYDNVEHHLKNHMLYFVRELHEVVYLCHQVEGNTGGH